jgi:hypothetical protein
LWAACEHLRGVEIGRDLVEPLALPHAIASADLVVEQDVFCEARFLRLGENGAELEGGAAIDRLAIAACAPDPLNDGFHAGVHAPRLELTDGKVDLLVLEHVGIGMTRVRARPRAPASERREENGVFERGDVARPAWRRASPPRGA